MKWKINYYLTETAFKSDIPAFSETINGDRNFVTNWAQNKIRNGNLKFFDIQQI